MTLIPIYLRQQLQVCYKLTPKIGYRKNNFALG
jgi:hypothetical protein